MKDRRTSYFYVEGKAALGSDVVIDIYFRTVVQLKRRRGAA
jgi:hypothetical protein